jgi:hypothetical protein
MKVSRPGASGAVAGGGGSRRPSDGGFAPAGAQGARESAAPAPAMGPSGVGGLDMLMALQAAPDPVERRRRQVRRAGRMLDVLDEVKLALLDGRDSGPALERLRGAMREAREGIGDAGLQGLLDQIETRAAVELAKREALRAAA